MLDIVSLVEKLTVLGTHEVADGWHVTFHRPPAHRRAELAAMMQATVIPKSIMAKQNEEVVTPWTTEETEAVYQYYQAAVQYSTNLPPPAYAYIADLALLTEHAALSTILLSAPFDRPSEKPADAGDSIPQEVVEEATDSPFLSPEHSESP